MDENDKQKLINYVCAFANSEDGTVVIGRNNQGNWTGFENQEENVDSKKNILKIIKEGIVPTPEIEVETYSYYENRIFATIRTKKQTNIFATTNEDRVFLIKENKIEMAKTKDIVSLSEENLLEKYAHLSITKRLTSISQKIAGTRDSIDILPMVRKIESHSAEFKSLFPHAKSCTLLSQDLENNIVFNQNGYSQEDGNVIFVEPTQPRLQNQYIRLTAPLGKVKLVSSDLDALGDQYSGEKIIIVPGGAIYFDNSDSTYAVSKLWSSMIFQSDKNHSGTSMKFVAGFLKSAIPLWYGDRCLGGTDLRNIRILSKIPVPIDVPSELHQNVVNLVDKLLELEASFLKTEVYELNRKPTDYEMLQAWKETRIEATIQHNNHSEKLVGKLEKLFFEILGFNEDEIITVEQSLISNNFKTFND